MDTPRLFRAMARRQVVLLLDDDAAAAAFASSFGFVMVVVYVCVLVVGSCKHFLIDLIVPVFCHEEPPGVFE
jgi:hypothetical protein